MVVAKVEDHMGRALGDGKHLAVGPLQLALSPLLARVEGQELQLLIRVAALKVEAGVGQNHRVEGIPGWLEPLGGKRGLEQDRVTRFALAKDGAVVLDHHLVHREGTGLVRAQHVHPGHLLDRRQTSHDGACP
eukprot:2509171-Rhodomonas_salina.1